MPIVGLLLSPVLPSAVMSSASGGTSLALPLLSSSSTAELLALVAKLALLAPWDSVEEIDDHGLVVGADLKEDDFIAGSPIDYMLELYPTDMSDLCHSQEYRANLPPAD